MTPIMKRTEKDDAVSPVVGVMLMLVVTIIIAAVVAAFASGVAGDTEKVPSVMLKVSIDTSWTNGWGKDGAIFITNVNGETIDTSKMEVIATNAAGNSYTFRNPSPEVSMGVDYRTIPSGNTLNVAYWGAPLVSSGNTNLAVSSGELVNVVITYNGKNILFNQDVMAA